MDDPFSAHRSELLALAYRMLGSAAEAEDVVQDAWLRWRSAAEVASPKPWLRTTVTRLCLDRLKSARARRETYVGPWLPEPLVTDASERDPYSVSLAFMLVLERLNPVERAVYLLHVVFELTHAEIGPLVDKSEAAVRQIFHRSKARVSAAKPRFAPSREQHGQLLSRFFEACELGDVDGLGRLLAAEARALTDGGGRVRAARNVVQGREPVARLFIGLAQKFGAADLTPEFADLNGWPACILREGSVVKMVVGIETDGVHIAAVHVILNPDKLDHL